MRFTSIPLTYTDSHREQQSTLYLTHDGEYSAINMNQSMMDHKMSLDKRQNISEWTYNQIFKLDMISHALYI